MKGTYKVSLETQKEIINLKLNSKYTILRK